MVVYVHILVYVYGVHHYITKLEHHLLRSLFFCDSNTYMLGRFTRKGVFIPGMLQDGNIVFRLCYHGDACDCKHTTYRTVYPTEV